MNVDPVVGEHVLVLDYQQHSQEVAVSQAAGAVTDIDGGLGLGDPDGRAQRQRRDHMRRGQRLATRDHLADPAVLTEDQFGDGRVQPHLAAIRQDLLRHQLPHLARSEPRVVELRDQ